MKTSKIYLLAAAFLLSGTLANAQLTGKENLEDKLYESSKGMPGDEWESLVLDKDVNDEAGEASAAIKEGKLNIKGGGDSKFSQAAFYTTNNLMNDFVLDPNKGYTIEIKAKVTKAAEYGAFTLQGFDMEGKGFRIGIYEDAIAESTNPLAVTNGLAKGDNTDDFHIYRLAVQTNGNVSLFRDGEAAGSFKLSEFKYDNIITNGNFEDESLNGWTALAGSAFTREEEESGNWMAVASTEGAATENLQLTYAPIPLKPDASYSLSFNYIRLEPYSSENWWRDIMVAYNKYDAQFNQTIVFGDDKTWKSKSVNVSGSAENKTLNYYHKAVKDKTNKTGLDNMYLAENLGLQRGVKMASPDATYDIPEYATNLITAFDPGFEFTPPTEEGDGKTNADGWVFAANGNENAAAMPQYGFYSQVRIQTGVNDGGKDTKADQVAHTGSYSLRHSSINDGNPGQRFQFRQQLQANKTYRFNFWVRNANYGDQAQLIFKTVADLVPAADLYTSGNDITEGTDITIVNIANMKNWSNIQVEFTTTAEEKVFAITSRRPGETYPAKWHHFYIDDLLLYEVDAAKEAADPFEGKTNLIVNGDFEDVTKDLNGNDYTWALSSERPTENASYGDNYPVKWSDDWNAYVRLQDSQKGNDTNEQWAHSGTRSLRISYLDDSGQADTFNNNYAEYGRYYEDENGDQQDHGRAYKQNVLFERDLEVGKTYTFRFWFRTANYGDNGSFYVSNGDYKLWGGSFSCSNYWKQHTITFTTTEANHTLKYSTAFTGWYNFYLDDLELYEHETTIPFEGGDSFLQFGKSTGIEETDVEIEYIAFDNTGAYAPYTPSDDASLKSITVDGVALEGFAADKLDGYAYFFVETADKKNPEVVAVANDDKASKPVVTYPDAYPGDIVITVTAEDGTTIQTYKIATTMQGIGFETPEAVIYAFVEDNVLNVVGAEAGAVISVYNIAGQLIEETTESAIALSAKGVYLVKVGAQIFKVLN